MSRGSANQENSRLDDYRIVAELARGGMAAVFLAVYEGAARPREIVAIKVVHPHLAYDPDFVAMLADEARIASSIGHPNVVEIREFVLGRADGRNYIVMEYADGETLSMFLKHGARGKRLSTALAASIAADVAGGLHAAHELRGPHGEDLQLVHRDVSPQNIIVTYDGRVKLTDFGVAKATGRIQRTQPGEIKGKLAYMAPEQAFGREVDRRSDVYALGVVLYELAMGRRLFGGKTDADTIRNVMQHNIVPPREIDPEFPEGLEQIILAMLTKEPADRFQTAGAAERALRGYLRSVGAGDLAASLGAFVRDLDPDRFRAKQELLAGERALLPPPGPPRPPPRGPEPDGHPDDGPTLLSGQIEDAMRQIGLSASQAPPRPSAPPPPRPSAPPPPRPSAPMVGPSHGIDQTVQAEFSQAVLDQIRASSAPPAAPMIPAAAPPNTLLWVAIVGGLLLIIGGAVAIVVLVVL
ncbi:MAG: serine/threonine-protein kinase [Deltaproteobacteria bacterium]|nr:serine/threonine-protein kinase [Myxococcales bacterium]MDP3218853.1 serine/threonine-protein kinase [Deltaproteobacteria bacterium]